MSSRVRPALPALRAEFIWTDQPWGSLLQCVPLAAVAAHGWTTRELTIAGGAARCHAQWHQLAATGGVGERARVAVHQVHGATVIDAHEVDAAQPPEADGLVSRDPALMLTVRVADCVSLLIADSRLGVVAAVHAGWRGTAAGIAGAAVLRMRDLYGSRPGDLIAALGPSIGPCCYTVGPEPIEVFRDHGHAQRDLYRWFGAGGRQRLDLWGANRDQLEAAGVPAATILVSELCTACHADWFYSHRREGAAAGRLVAFICAPHGPSGRRADAVTRWE
jgi:polyphenol oxidase